MRLPRGWEWKVARKQKQLDPSTQVLASSDQVPVLPGPDRFTCMPTDKSFPFDTPTHQHGTQKTPISRGSSSCAMEPLFVSPRSSRSLAKTVKLLPRFNWNPKTQHL